MEIQELSAADYKHGVVKPFSGFDTAEFAELNKHKAEEVKYFVFNNGKNRFGLVAGIKEGVLKCPFSATFGIFSEITHNNQISHYHEAVKALTLWAEKRNLKKIIISCPPNFYDEAHIAKFQNALHCNHFAVLDYDVNFAYDVSKFKAGYAEHLLSDARRHLKIALKEQLSFEKTEDLSSVYAIIKQNRQEKGFPLWMSEEDVRQTSRIIPSDLFLVKNNAAEAVASAYVQHIKEGIVNVVYWGNLQISNRQRAMNFMAYKVFEYYANQPGIKFVSIGTSTKDSIPNTGLCNFKESIGCTGCAKLSFVWENK